jgi:hypothetical protein
MFLSMAADRHSTTPEAIQEKLGQGEQVRYDDDWYANIRNKPQPRKRQKFAPTFGLRCRRCGQSEFSGAMFTTDPGSGFCDDCYG